MERDGLYEVTEILVPPVDAEAGVRLRWKVTNRRTGSVEVVALLRPTGAAPALACTCSLPFCNHRQEILPRIGPTFPPPDGQAVA